MNRIPFLLIFLLVAIVSAGQTTRIPPNKIAVDKEKIKAVTKPDYRLLWKISGNGLVKPSYLFGTMHVTDTRAFDFNDSLFTKLSECEGFALEVHPDSLVKSFYLWVEQAPSRDNEFLSMFSRAEYTKLDSILFRKSGYTFEQLRSPQMLYLHVKDLVDTRKDPMDNYSRTFQKTFLDAWLFNIARQQGKVLGGVEEPLSHLSAFGFITAADIRDLINGTSRPGSWMFSETKTLTVYNSGDIYKLRDMMKSVFSPQQYDQLITSRNVQMTDAAIRLMHQRSTFIAVGAGHLAGEEGIIQLLKNKGYILSPVLAPFSGKKPTIAETGTGPWFEYESPDAGYSVSMPNKPFSYSIDSLALTMQAYVDVGNGISYQATHYLNDEEINLSNREAALDRILQRIKSTRGITIVESKRISTPGDGFEYTYREQNQTHRAMLIARGKLLYQLDVGWTRAATQSASADRFFRSFKLKDFKANRWTMFTETTGAFRIEFPGKPRISRLRFGDTPAEKGEEVIYLAQDNASGKTFSARYFDVRSARNWLGSDSAYCASIIQHILDSWKAKAPAVRNLNIQGLPAWEFRSKSESIGNIKGITLLRGNRFMMLIGTWPQEDSVDSHYFLNTFHLEELQRTPLKVHQLQEKLIIQLPADPIPDTLSNPGNPTEWRYVAFDPNTSAAYTITVNQLSPYTETTDWDTFFNSYEGWQDTTISSTSLKTNSYQGKHSILRRHGGNLITHRQSMVSGRWKIEVKATTSEDDHTGTIEQVLQSPILTILKDPWDIFAHKSDILLQDLQSTDSVKRGEAFKALGSYAFQTSDVQSIQAATKRTYLPVATDYQFESIGEALFYALSRVNDSTTLSHIEEQYPLAPDSTRHREAMLRVLVSLNQKQASKSMLQKLAGMGEKSPKPSSYFVLNPYWDYPERMNEIVPDIIRLANRFDYPSDVIQLVNNALDSGFIDDRKATEIALLEFAREAINTKPVEGDDDHLELHTSLARSLGFVQNPEAIAMLRQYSTWSNPMIRMVALFSLIQLNQKINQKLPLSIARDVHTRFELHTLLKEKGRLDLYPRSMLKPAPFAEGRVVYLLEEEEMIQTISRVAASNAQYLGKDTAFFLFRYTYDYEKGEAYYAVVGLVPGSTEEVYVDYGLEITSDSPAARLTGVIESIGGKLIK